MAGEMSVEDAFESRIALISPSRAAISRFLEDHTPTVNPGVCEFLEVLRQRNIPFFLVSGGFFDVSVCVLTECLVDCPGL